MTMFKRITAAVLLTLAGGILLFTLYRRAGDAVAADPEVRIISYLRDNVRPGQAVLVTDLYNNVFTSPEEREALQRLYDVSLKVPAFAAETYASTGRIPTLADLSNQFHVTTPGGMDVLLRAIESDPRVARFFERDPSTGEITKIYPDRIAADERFGKPLRDR
jgi:hypothetical protein